MIELTERQAQIAEALRKEEFLNVERLAVTHSVTAQTIRRDFNLLCDYGLARRRHGGIERATNAGNIAYQFRQVLAQGAKRVIADEVARHIPDDVSVAFSIGTTPEVVAQGLLNHHGMRVFTNNIGIAILACTNPSFKVHIPGGSVRNSDCDVLGSGIDKFFSSYLFDFGIYGVAGVGERGTLLDFHEDEVRARQLIHENSRTTFLVLDDTKFGRTAHVRGGQIGQATKVFCNRKPPEQIVEVIGEAGSELIICGDNESS